MKVSRSSLLGYQIPDNLWFLDRNETKVIDDKEFISRNEYFMQHPALLEAGLYCAVGGNPNLTSNNAAYNELVWELERYNGINWVAVNPTQNYSLTITNEGLKALANATNGTYKVEITQVQIIADVISNPARPIISWTNNDFYDKETRNHDLVIDWSDDVLKNHLTWRVNLGNGGIQYQLSLNSDTVAWDGRENFNVGSIGLFINNPNDSTQKILFGVACLPAAIAKYATNVSGTGNSLRFYLNTIIDNLGYISNVTQYPSDDHSIPEIENETDLINQVDGLSTMYNMYLVNNLMGTNLPALATRQLSDDGESINWMYFTPSSNLIQVDASSFAPDVLNYMFVYWDSATSLYKPADGADKEKLPVGMRSGNAIILTGDINNASLTYLYSPSVQKGSGLNYSRGDKLYYTATGNGSSVTFDVIVVDVDPSGAILDVMITPPAGQVLVNVEDVHLQYAGGYGVGSGALFSCTSTEQSTVIWNYPSSWINNNAYVDTGANVGLLTNVNHLNEEDLPVGRFLGPTSVRYTGVSTAAVNDASTTSKGITQYATSEEVGNVKNSGLSASFKTVVPQALQNNYIQKTNVSGNPGDAASNPIYVDTHLKFRTPIVSEITNGVAFQGLAYRAVYGDLAEYYRSDKAYDPGTLIVIGSGPAEITLARGECNGIISEYPGYELGEKKDEKDLLVALVGRVNVLFDGLCSPKFGDKIYLSAITPGRASTIPNGSCLGKIIDKSPEGKIKIMCSVRINF